MSLPATAEILSLSRRSTTVHQLLEEEMGLVWISAEISNFTQPASGHWYFTLKDDGAQVRCAMFRNSNRRVTFRPQHGQQVLVRANITLYEPRGDYQLIAESMHPAGEGLLQQQLELLKAKLASEGSFEPQHKQPLPAPARQAGVLTTPPGPPPPGWISRCKARDRSSRCWRAMSATHSPIPSSTRSPRRSCPARWRTRARTFMTTR